jgi:hypothetical protein
MKNHPAAEKPGYRRAFRGVGVAAALGCASFAAQAIDFSNDSGTVTGSWDTTFTYGQAWRVQSPDCHLVATADGGCGRSPNIDDGDINYGTGTVSRAWKVVTELSVKSEHYGAFVRGAGLYDQEVEDSNTRRTPISSSAKHLAGSYARLLDAFAYGKWDLGTHPFELRLGRQAVSWGESTFIQGGVNTLNPFDVSALRVPGSELKEAFLPESMVFASLGLSENVTIDGVYMLDWTATQPEPSGTFFSSNDFAPRGGDKVVLGFGAFSDQGVDFTSLGIPGFPAPFITNYQQVPRGPTQEPKKSGQYGAALHWYAPNFMNGTEFGFYFINYHSRLPLISGQTGTQAGIGNAAGAATAVAGAAQALAGGLPPAAAIAAAAGAAVNTSNSLGGNLTLATATQYATIGVGTAISGGNVSAQANGLATHEYAQTARYFTEFPEDIQLIGVSFNTQLQRSGIALQGEVTYHKDQPIQYDDVELLFAALGPLEVALFPLSAPPGTPFPTTCSAPIFTVTRCNQLGAFGLNQKVQGWDRHDSIQVQFTATKAFSNVLGAAQMVMVGEVGLTHFQGLADKLTGGPNGRGLRYNGPGTSVSGNAELASRHFGEVEPQNRFADATSWGVRLAGRLDYLGLVGPWNVSPRYSIQYDVHGTTPGPGGNFVDGRLGVTVGVNMNLQSKWDLDASYTRYSGAGRWNDINDRDFIAASIKYSF